MGHLWFLAGGLVKRCLCGVRMQRSDLLPWKRFGGGSSSTQASSEGAREDGSAVGTNPDGSGGHGGLCCHCHLRLALEGAQGQGENSSNHKGRKASVSDPGPGDEKRIHQFEINCTSALNSFHACSAPKVPLSSCPAFTASLATLQAFTASLATALKWAPLAAIRFSHHSFLFPHSPTFFPNPRTSLLSLVPSFLLLLSLPFPVPSSPSPPFLRPRQQEQDGDDW